MTEAVRSADALAGCSVVPRLACTARVPDETQRAYVAIAAFVPGVAGVVLGTQS